MDDWPELGGTMAGKITRDLLKWKQNEDVPIKEVQ
jgi:hypothetical protein